MSGLTEDQIEPLCQRLFEAVRDSKDEEVAALAIQLLSGFLIDINRLAWFAQQIAAVHEANRQ
jgi:hypothetical protein